MTSSTPSAPKTNISQDRPKNGYNKPRRLSNSNNTASSSKSQLGSADQLSGPHSATVSGQPKIMPSPAPKISFAAAAASGITVNSVAPKPAQVSNASEPTLTLKPQSVTQAVVAATKSKPVNK